MCYKYPEYVIIIVSSHDKIIRIIIAIFMLVFGLENSVQIVLQGGTYEKCFDCVGGD